MRPPAPPHLLRLIQSKGHNITTFSQAVGVSHTFLSRLIHTKRWPGLETALRISNALGVEAASIWPIGGRARVPKRRAGE